MISIHEIMESTTKKKLEILDLLEMKSDYVRYNEIVEKIKLSRNTAEKYIIELQSYLEDMRHEKKSLIKDRSGARLVIKSLSEHNRLRVSIIESDLSICLFKNLILGDSVNEVKFSEQYFISGSSYRRKLTRIRRIIEKNHLEISKQKGNVVLLGDEWYIRSIARKYFWDIYKGEVWPFEKISKEYVGKILSTLTELSMRSKINLINIQQVFNLVGIQLMRSRNGYNFTSPKHLKIESNYIVKFFFFHRDRRIFKDEGELVYFFLSLMAAPRFLETPLGKTIRTITKENNSFLHKVNERFIRHFQNEFFTLSEQEIELIEPGLYASHLVSILYPKAVELEDLAKDESPYSFPNLRKKLEVLLERCIKNKFDLNSSNLIKKYFLIFGQIRKLSIYEEEVSILLNTDTGVLNENIVMRKMYNYFGDRYNIHCYTKFTEDRVGRYDLTIVTSMTPEINVHFSDSTIVYVKQGLEFRDIISIEKKLLEIKNRKIKK